MSTEPRFWSQRFWASALVLDGVVLDKTPRDVGVSRVYGGAVPILFHDGTGAIGKPFPVSGGPELGTRYAFDWDDQATTEAHWQAIRRRAERAQPVYFITYRPETESFVLPTAAAGSTVTLSRKTAKSAYASFDEALYPASAELAGSALTVAAGAPGAGEFGITDATLTLGDATTAGDVLYVSYYPAYYVLVEVGDEVFRGFNDLGRKVTVTELGE